MPVRLALPLTLNLQAVSDNIVVILMQPRLELDDAEQIPLRLPSAELAIIGPSLAVPFAIVASSDHPFGSADSSRSAAESCPKGRKASYRPLHAESERYKAPDTFSGMPRPLPRLASSHLNAPWWIPAQERLETHIVDMMRQRDSLGQALPPSLDCADGAREYPRPSAPARLRVLVALILSVALALIHPASPPLPLTLSYRHCVSSRRRCLSGAPLPPRTRTRGASLDRDASFHSSSSGDVHEEDGNQKDRMWEGGQQGHGDLGGFVAIGDAGTEVA
ncbi:hypothetical protein MSAN_01891300 [Mycena sanguinolenta]|uniref:Uncharacterized protein n=1 Tax=Mycena sanguinolenta TaxID=230812 RepID=A0A8H6XRA0_9AGAR|nr:hypothetical protein MSAN_01891300 [Mycena sanguinolenta]